MENKITEKIMEEPTLEDEEYKKPDPKDFIKDPDKEAIIAKLVEIKSRMNIIKYFKRVREFTSMIENKYPENEPEKYKLYNAISGNTGITNEPHLDFEPPDSVKEFIKKLESDTENKDEM
jgi:hypothetical protein